MLQPVTTLLVKKDILLFLSALRLRLVPRLVVVLP